MKLLKCLDLLHEWVGYVRRLLIGRSALIILVSLSGWAFEILALRFFAGSIGIPFSIRDFNDYINSIFLVGTSSVAGPYHFVVTLLFAVLTAAFSGIWLYRVAAGRKRMHLKEDRG